MRPTTRSTCRCIGGSATLLGQTGLLYAGDCKMAALETRAEIAAAGDFYLTRLPHDRRGRGPVRGLGGGGADRRRGRRSWSRSGVEDELIGVGYEFERSQSAVVGQTEHTWSERVQIIRSEASGPEPSRGPGAAAGESRGGPARLDAAAGAGPDPVHDRLGVGAGRGRGPGRASRSRGCWR